MSVSGLGSPVSGLGSLVSSLSRSLPASLPPSLPRSHSTNQFNGARNKYPKTHWLIIQRFSHHHALKRTSLGGYAPYP